MRNYLSLIIVIFVLISCDKTDVLTQEQNVEVQDFVWKGMNAFYLWQENVSDLDDRRFSSQKELNEYLVNYPNPEELFYNLRHQPGVIDKYSWIVEDYVALENSFQGINESNGMEFGLVQYADGSENVFGYVRYVIPNSDAEFNGVTRGMIFNKINATQITTNNYIDLITTTSYTISLADYNAGNPIENGNTMTLVKSQLQENPIAISKVFQEGPRKIGYLLYNQFASSYDVELNNVFANFYNENITDLIIDLRYNGGGSVRSATYLGAMVTGQFNGQLYSQEEWNSKVMDAFNDSFFINNFTDRIVKEDAMGNVIVNEQINSLQLNSVYFITSRRTASASELTINSLDAYIDVKTVGKTTVGKVHGSVTLYDSDNLTKSGPNFNNNHTWALQPLVLEIQNKDRNNHPNGISPFIDLGEDYGNLGVLGEKSDPLLDRTLTLITTGSKGSIGKNNTIQLEEIGSSKELTKAFNNMRSILKK